MHRRICWLAGIFLLCLMLPGGVILAQAPTRTPIGVDLEIISPIEGSEVGGMVSILGTAAVQGMRGYTLSLGVGAEPVQWILISDVREVEVTNDRLAFWDTTTVPDGIYTLRLRAVSTILSVSIWTIMCPIF
ncbi:MAG TPA: hypothetical protein GX702_16055 [Chloroflexi bacterium]|jgi:hypothetical protein|nr:hypothetical protein [Chloroflexota bacterium]